MPGSGQPAESSVARPRGPGNLSKKRHARTEPRGNAHAWTDARLAAAVPPHHRSCCHQPSRARDRDARGGRGIPHHQLQGVARAGATRRATPRPRRDQARRPDRDLGLEYVEAP